MEMKEFAQKVLVAVKGKLGEGYRVEIKEVRKNNGILLHGLVILSETKNVVPTIYLEIFMAAYEDGVPFSKIIDKILDVYQEEMPKGDVSMEFFKEFDKVSDRICYRLIRRKGNEALLEEIPHVEFMDLAICFFYAYQGGALGDGSIPIYNSHLEMWKVGTKELMTLAGVNTPRIYPAELRSMTDILKETAQIQVIGGPVPESNLDILTNDRRAQGAACILYPGMLERIATVKKRSFYIIPSSVHEVLILRDTGRENVEEIKKTIREVNSRFVAKEEILSDNLYYYDFVSKTVKIIF